MVSDLRGEGIALFIARHVTTSELSSGETTKDATRAPDNMKGSLQCYNIIDMIVMFQKLNKVLIINTQ